MAAGACAGRMEEDYDGARRREAVFRGVTARRRRWLSRKWRTSNKGNPYLNVDGYNIVIFARGAGDGRSWGFRVTNQITDDAIASRRPYPSEDAAKLRAFDGMIWMKERGR